MCQYWCCYSLCGNNGGFRGNKKLQIPCIISDFGGGLGGGYGGSIGGGGGGGRGRRGTPPINFP